MPALLIATGTLMALAGVSSPGRAGGSSSSSAAGCRSSPAPRLPPAAPSFWPWGWSGAICAGFCIAPAGGACAGRVRPVSRGTHVGVFHSRRSGPRRRCRRGGGRGGNRRRGGFRLNPRLAELRPENRDGGGYFLRCHARSGRGIAGAGSDAALGALEDLLQANRPSPEPDPRPGMRRPRKRLAPFRMPIPTRFPPSSFHHGRRLPPRRSRNRSALFPPRRTPS